MRHTESGAFSAEFAAKKRWKLDENLLKAIKAVLPSRDCSVIDLGAGIGVTVKALREAGWTHVEGVDGIPGIKELSGGVVTKLDLTEPYLWTRTYGTRENIYGWRPDVAICIEVGEHILEAKQEQFLNNLADAASQMLVVSYAVPGQRGRDHVCCRSPEWVANQLGRRGWLMDEELTMRARDIAGKGWDKKLLIFKVTEAIT